jgi:hypothetical protein
VLPEGLRFSLGRVFATDSTLEKSFQPPRSTVSFSVDTDTTSRKQAGIIAELCININQHANPFAKHLAM